MKEQTFIQQGKNNNPQPMLGGYGIFSPEPGRVSAGSLTQN
jgi:hypothetical protein